jgi:large subunit ribosomal protein L20
MARIKRGVAAHRRHKRLLKTAKGYRGKRKATVKQARTAWMKAGLHSYESRKLKKRTFRSLWIARINAACRPLGISYSRLISKLAEHDVMVNRKMLAELAVNDPDTFKAIVESVK